MSLRLRALFLPALILIGIYVIAGGTPPVPDLIPMRVAEKWGYCDQGRNMVIRASFDAASPFHDGRAVVRAGGNYGLIDRNGRFLLAPAYAEIQPGEFLRVRQGKRYALATAEGRFLCEFAYDRILAKRSGLFMVERNGQYGMIDTAGKLIVPVVAERVQHLRDDQGNYTDLIAVWADGQASLYDRCGTDLGASRYARVDVFQEGFAVVQKHFKFGLIDLEGREVIPALYDQLYPLSEGLVPAQLRGHWGFLDQKGAEVIPFRYSAVHEDGFYQGRAAVLYRGSWIFIDRKGEPEIPINGKFQSLGALSEGFAAAGTIDLRGRTRYGYLNPEGEILIPFEFDRAEAFSDGMAVVGLKGNSEQSIVGRTRYGLIGRDGKYIIPPVLETRSLAEYKRDSLSVLGVTSFLEGGRRCRVDRQGNRFDCEKEGLPEIQLNFTRSRCESGPLVAVSENEKWGFCDRKGKIVIPASYSWVECFSDGLALVRREANGPAFYIDMKGTEYFTN